MKSQQKAGAETAPTLGGLPYLPLNPAWVQESPCFLSGDASLVRAGINMLVAAWRNAPKTSIPSSYPSLSLITGLPEASIASAFPALVYGWELHEGRLVHVEMQKFCDALWARHGEGLAHFVIDAAAVAQAPEEFELVGDEPVSSRTKGRRRLTPQWSPSQKSMVKLEAMGFNQDQCAAIISKMRNWADSGAVMKNDWDATLMIFADREPRPPKSGVVPFVPANGRFGGLVNKGEAARATNQSVMSQVRNERA